MQLVQNIQPNVQVKMSIVIFFHQTAAKYMKAKHISAKKKEKKCFQCDHTAQLKWKQVFAQI